MANKTPTNKIASHIRELNSLLDEEKHLQENLVDSLEAQAKILAHQYEILKEINIAKALTNRLQKESETNSQKTNLLENNILKRNQRLLENETQLDLLNQKKISQRSKDLLKTKESQQAMLDLVKIWGKIRDAQVHSKAISKEDLAILNKAAQIQGVSLNRVLVSNKNIRQKTIAMMRYAQILDLERKIEYDKLEILREQDRLKKEYIEGGKLQIENWFKQKAIVQKVVSKIDLLDALLKASGIKTNLIAKLMSGPVLFTLVGITKLLSESWNLFKKLDEEAFKARKEMGMMREEHQVLRSQAEDLYKKYANLGVAVDHVYRSQKQIALELGSTLSATEDIVLQTSLMSSQFGIAEETTVKMLKNMGQMFSTTANAQISMSGFVRELSNASGVPLPQVMQDIANASETTRIMFAKTPLDMMKAAVEARRLGTTLDKMSESSRKILNFTESMESEMEASVLLGRPINLQLARQLSYAGKIKEANLEILRISKQIDFDHLDPFTAEAFARATGKTVSELKSMLQANREDILLRQKASTDPSIAKRLRDLEKMKEASESIARARGEDANYILKTRENQDRLTSITNSYKKVVMELGYQFLPIIDNVLKIAAALTPLIGIGMRMMIPFSLISAALSKIPKNVIGLHLVNYFHKIVDVVTTLGTKFQWLGKIFTLVGRLFGVIKFAGPFIKQIPVIGWIISGLQFIYEYAKRLIKIYNDPNMNFAQKIWAGFWAIGESLYEVLVQPFVDLWNWAKEHILGQSPSYMGLLIVEGIKAVGGMLFNNLIFPFKNMFKWIINSKPGMLIINSIKLVGNTLFDLLTSPFKSAYNWIIDLWSGIGNIITTPLKKIWDFIGNKRVIQASIEKPILSAKAASLDIPLDKALSDSEIKSYKELDKGITKDSVKQTSKSTEENTTSIAEMQSAILTELKNIRKDLLDGKIAVNLDGQLVSTTMNRNNSFRGTYGAMQR